MIILDGVSKVLGAGDKKRTLLAAVRVRLPSDQRIAVFGATPEDKKVFIDLLGGVTMPSSGRIIRRARVGFPAGHVGGFTADLSVRLNVAHVARLYGADVHAVVDFVAEAAGLGDSFNKAYGQLAAPKRRHLSEVLAFSIPFDVYLLNDDLVRAGAKGFSREANALFEARTKTSGMIIASNDPAFARRVCQMGVVLRDGELRLFKDIERAIKFSEIPLPSPEEKQAEIRKAARRKRQELRAVEK